LPLRDASVGAVVSFETLLEHVREHARFMRKLSACCAPAGGLSSVPTRRLIPLSQVALDVVCGRSAVTKINPSNQCNYYL